MKASEKMSVKHFNIFFSSFNHSHLGKASHQAVTTFSFDFATSSEKIDQLHHTTVS